MIDAFPRAKALLAGRGYDAAWFRHALADRGIAACIPSKTNRKVPIAHDTALYRQRHKVENMSGKLKDDWDSIDAAFLTALDLPHSERIAWPEDVFGGDEDKIERLARLLDNGNEQVVLFGRLEQARDSVLAAAETSGRFLPIHA